MNILKVTLEQLAALLGSYYSNIPSDARALECWYDRENETLEIKIEHPTMTETPEGNRIDKIMGLPYYENN